MALNPACRIQAKIPEVFLPCGHHPSSALDRRWPSHQPGALGTESGLKEGHVGCKTAVPSEAHEASAD